MQLPDVLLQVEVAAEAFATSGAGEGLLVVVCVHVEGQVVDLVEGLIADGALVLFLPAVRQLVVLVVSFLVEAFPAELAHKWFIPCVDPDVSVESRTSVERFSTLVAFVRLFLRVDDLVSAQRAGLPESFTAHLTYEGPGPRVHRHVSGKIVMRIKNLSTHFAGEIFGFSVRTATAAEFAVCLYAAFLSCQAVALLHYLVQLPWQMFLVWVLRCGQLVGAHTGQFGILQQQKSVVRRQRGLGLRAGEPVAGQQLRLLVRRVQVIEIVERATAGHGLVQDLRFYHPAP